MDPTIISTMMRTALNAAAVAVHLRAENKLNTITKPDGSLATDADVASENLIRGVLHEMAPTVYFLGEESANLLPWVESGKQGSSWVVDPIDGTSNFVKRRGPWAVSIALQEDGVTQAACVFVCNPGTDDNVTGTLYCGAEGGEQPLYRVEIKQGNPSASPSAIHDQHTTPADVMRIGKFIQDFDNGKYVHGGEHSGHMLAALKNAIGNPDATYPVQCACADMLSLLDNRTSVYAHGIHAPWDSAAAAYLLMRAGVYVMEYDQPSDTGKSAVIAAFCEDRLTALSAAFEATAEKLNGTPPPLSANCTAWKQSPILAENYSKNRLNF